MHSSTDQRLGDDGVTLHTCGERAAFRGGCCSPSVTMYTVAGTDVRLLLVTQKLGDRSYSFTLHTVCDGDLADSVTMTTLGDGGPGQPAQDVTPGDGGLDGSLKMHTLGNRDGHEPPPSIISTVADELQRDILVTLSTAAVTAWPAQRDLPPHILELPLWNTNGLFIRRTKDTFVSA
ncbi:hypothetical protein MRX96_013642 [Rhipicephalus microplus]